MDSRSIKQAITVAKRAYDTFSDYQDRKAREAYDSLLNAADSYDDVADNVAAKVNEGKKQATTLTEQARKRAQAAIAEAQAKKDELAKDGKSLVKSTKKDIAKSKKQGLKNAKKLRKQASNKPTFGQRVGRAGLFSVILAAVAGVIYLVLEGKKSPAGTQPPKASDFKSDGTSPTPNDVAAGAAAGAANVDAQAAAEAEEPTLVYSTQTPAEDRIASPEEGAVERDEELLGSLDEQMAKHRLITDEEREEEMDPNEKKDVDPNVNEVTGVDLNEEVNVDPELHPEQAEEEAEK